MFKFIASSEIKIPNFLFIPIVVALSIILAMVIAKFANKIGREILNKGFTK